MFALAERLAFRAPVGGPVVVTLSARPDLRAAAGTGAARTSVDGALRPAGDRVAHEARGRRQHREQLVVAELSNRTPRRDASVPERLRLPQVADPRDEPLVEERVADGAARMLTAQVRDHLVESCWLGEDVGAEGSGRLVVELEDGSVPEHGLAIASSQDEPRATYALLPARLDAPASPHAQVAPHDDPALEAQEKVLPDRLDADQDASVDALRDSAHRCPRVRSLDLDALAHERLQPVGGAAQGVAFGHAASVARRPRGRQTLLVNPPVRAAAAGALAATAWGALEPLDRRLFRCDYSDIALLGKAVTRGPRWRLAGFALHAVNGAVFGLAFHEARSRVPIPPRRLAFAAALAEHVALYPLAYLVDRYHPARGEPGVPPLLRNPRAFAQAGVRHALFGVLLGRLA